jgi:hypothetical protein
MTILGIRKIPRRNIHTGSTGSPVVSLLLLQRLLLCRCHIHHLRLVTRRRPGRARRRPERASRHRDLATRRLALPSCQATVSSQVTIWERPITYTAGGFWSPLAADAQQLSFSCFPLPGSPIKPAAVELESGSGAKLWEVVDTFSSATSASQAYTNFANTVNNCSWQSTSSVGTTSKFTAVPDSNAPSRASASGLWDVEGAPEGDLDVAPSHDGAIIAVQSGKFDAFAYVAVDTGNNPSLTVLESNIEPTLAGKL